MENNDVFEAEFVEEELNNDSKFDKAFNSATDIFTKAVDKAKEGVKYVYDHPAQTMAFIGSLWAGYKTVVRPVLRDINEARSDYHYYDRYGSQHTYECKRRLTNNEMYQLDEYVKGGGNAYEWLRAHRLARK